MRCKAERPVLIAGGGPVGVIAALALAQQGISVHLFEARDRIDTSPRAATLHASTLEMLGRLGLINEVIENGLVEPLFRIWNRATNQIVAQFDFRLLENDTPYPYAVQYEQHKLVHLALEHLRDFAHAKVEFSAPVLRFQQFNDRVEILVRRAQGTRTVKGRYLIGADGTHSGVRCGLGIEFEGYTHPERFLILTTTCDFEGRFDGCVRNWFSDPDEWCGLFKVAGDDGRGLWRLLFPTAPDEIDAKALESPEMERRLQRFVRRSTPYPIVHRTLYRVHQKVAATFRRGRIFLAGDAAHANNPLGGLGLNFGVHDALELCDLIGRVILQDHSPGSLELYDARRRHLSLKYLQEQTIANKRRMEEKNQDARAADFELLRRIASEPAAQRAYLLRASLLESIR